MSSPELPRLRSAGLLGALLGREVQFLVVGGVGAQLHGATRATIDLDVCVPWTQENFDRLARALEDLDARLDLPPELRDVEVRPSRELLARTSMTRWITPSGVLDILQEIPAGDRGEPRGYTDLEPKAVWVRGADRTVLVAALEDIITSKEHANRDKDRAALPNSTPFATSNAPAEAAPDHGFRSHESAALAALALRRLETSVPDAIQHCYESRFGSAAHLLPRGVASRFARDPQRCATFGCFCVAIPRPPG